MRIHENWKNVEGATEATLNADTEGAYRCLVTDANGNKSYTDPVVVTEKLHITAQPDYQSSSDSLSFAWAGGMGPYQRGIQVYGGAWTEQQIMTSHEYFDSATDKYISFYESIFYQPDYANSCSVRMLENGTGPGTFRGWVMDTMTGEIVYTNSTVVK